MSALVYNTCLDVRLNSSTPQNWCGLSVLVMDPAQFPILLYGYTQGQIRTTDCTHGLIIAVSGFADEKQQKIQSKRTVLSWRPENLNSNEWENTKKIISSNISKYCILVYSSSLLSRDQFVYEITRVLSATNIQPDLDYSQVNIWAQLESPWKRTGTHLVIFAGTNQSMYNPTTGLSR